MDRMQRVFVFRLFVTGTVWTGLCSIGLLSPGTIGVRHAAAQSAANAQQPAANGQAVAEALLEYGRANHDPESIIAAVGIFAKSQTGHQASTRNLSGLLAEAMALRPDDAVLVALADRVADDPAARATTDEEDDDEKTRQAPAFLQKRSAAPSPAATAKGTGDTESDDAATRGADPDASGAETPVVPSEIAPYQHTFIEIALSIGLLVFGGVLVGLQALLMITQKRYWDDWAIKVTGLTLVITAGLLLIVAGYSEEQAAPMMGMLGTVAGYLLGKEGGA